MLSFSIALLFSPMSSALQADEPFAMEGKVENAALVYWQAFAVLPELSAEDVERLKLVETGEAEPESVSEILESCQTAMTLAKQVEADDNCKWQIIVDGPYTLLSHLSKARLLSRLYAIQARVDAAADNTSSAVDYLNAAFILSRHVDEGVLVQMLVARAIEGLALDSIEKIAGELEEDELVRLAKHMDDLPAPASFRSTMAYERDLFSTWLEPIVIGDDPRAEERIKDILPDAENADSATLLSGSKEMRRMRFEEYTATFDRIIEVAEGPVADRYDAFKAIEDEISRSPNPIIQMLMPGCFAAYRRFVESDERFEEVRMKIGEMVEEE